MAFFLKIFLKADWIIVKFYREEFLCGVVEGFVGGEGARVENELYGGVYDGEEILVFMKILLENFVFLFGEE